MSKSSGLSLPAACLWGWVMAALAASLPARAQSVISLTNGVQRYAALTNTTVNMSGRCELWVTDSSTPLSGCTINLNSIDAWLFLPGVKPSLAAGATTLQQVRVNGAAAVVDSNVRVVQYGQSGAVLIPQSSTFQPLTLFTEPQFGGTATAYSPWTYYTGSGLGRFSSFKLKRGYQVVLAQSAEGKKWSKCYVAQDGDLEIGVLPATLDKQVQFLYVTPWRWSSKKGIAGNPGISWLNVLWWYDWNIDQSSSRDLEYVAIRQNQYWPGLGQNWQALGVNTLLGYNEPDSTSQANLSVSTAISAWGDLLGTGLRVGSPATTDAGRSSWLYPFVSQADAAGLRVDFVAAHYYWAWNPSDPNGAANQMYNFLLDIWNNTHRPIWVTEWNNGANWTDNNPYPPPSYAQQQACLAAMVNMLESTPFVERYALFNWVGDTRSLVTSSNTVTAAGTTYSNTVSNLSYSQALPDNGTRGIAQFLFAANTWDSSGYGNNGMAVGAPAYTTGHNSQAQALVLDGANSYVQLPANIAKANAFTFAAWVYWNGGGAWQRIFDFGNDTSHYLFLTPNSGAGTLRFAISTSGPGGEQVLEHPGALTSGSWQHLAVTLNGNTAILYLNGAQVASSTSFSIAPSAFIPIKNYLGKSQFPADPLFSGKLEAVEIADYAMTAAQISTLYTTAPSPLPAYASGIWTLNGNGTWGTSNNWSGGLIANGGNGVNYSADFSTLNIAADRTVTLDSSRSIGGLKFGDTFGAQNWILTGANTLTLDTGSTNVPTIAVNQNTATLSTPLAGTNGFAKTGAGALVLTANNSLGGGLLVKAGSVSISGGATVVGTGVSSIGYETGAGTLNLAGNFTALGNVWVGGSDQGGTAYNATGTLNVSSGTARFGGPGGYAPHYADGSLAIAAGNNYQNACSGIMTVSGGTVWCTNDLIVGFAGTGTGTLTISGTGTVNVGAGGTRWLSLGKWDTSNGNINVSGGSLNLLNNNAIKLSSGNGLNNGGGGANTITQNGGTVTFYSNGGTTVGGSGYLDLSQSGTATANNTYHLNGGTLMVPQITSGNANGTRTFNFNGGTLKAVGANAAWMNLGTGNATANVRHGGAIIDTAGFNVTIAQALQHSAVGGDSVTDGGLTKLGNGTLTLSGANTYTGPTTVAAGTLELAQATLAAGATVSVASGAVLQLDFAATNTVAGLVLNGVAQAPGLYNRTAASPYLTGSGSLWVPTASNPTNLTVALNGSTLQLSWPLDHLGWVLQVATNLPAPFWVDVPGSGSVTSTNLSINPAIAANFFRLRYP